ncbi:hypothetical protein CP532_6205 [Ophiocordyceps camponoti-leonardi (nom. inval.)]|nr:hypothetical protein CP532_6205 [Ophiocordyceps camponoti-leonardi (nom. inval.)]
MNTPPATDPSAILSRDSSLPSRDGSSNGLDVLAADFPIWATPRVLTPFSRIAFTLQVYLLDNNDHELRMLRLFLLRQLSNPREAVHTKGQDEEEEKDDDDNEVELPGLEPASSSSEYTKDQEENEVEEEEEETEKRSSDKSSVKETLKSDVGRDSLSSDQMLPGGPLAARHLPLHLELQEAGLGGLIPELGEGDGHHSPLGDHEDEVGS